MYVCCVYVVCSFEDNAVTAIQAMVRGGLTRKLTPKSSASSMDSETGEHTTEDNNTEEEESNSNTNNSSSAANEQPPLQISASAEPATPRSITYNKKYDARGMPLRSSAPSIGSSPGGLVACAHEGLIMVLEMILFLAIYFIRFMDESRESPSHHTYPAHLTLGATATVRGIILQQANELAVDFIIVSLSCVYAQARILQ
jgi:hypothetical protein